jgi:hypothetical protein
MPPRISIPGSIRKTEVVMIHKTFATILTIPLLTGVLSAQSLKTQALLMAMGANGKQMTSYQWKQKTTVIRKGNSLEPMIDELRFDATNQIQRITLVKPEEKKMGPLRARKAAEVKDSIQQVMQLARRYASPQLLSDAIRKGEIWEGPHALRVQARSVLLPIDEMTMQVNGSTYLATRIDFKTQYEGSPVAIAIDYQQLPGGPSMMTRMTVQVPKENIIVNVESFDFVCLAGPVSFEFVSTLTEKTK